MSTAGFGVFAGRAFEQAELVPASWKTLFLTESIPRKEFLYNYVFSFNSTHMGLVLDYGSLFNHHENANVHAGGPRDVQFQVRVIFQYANCNALKTCSVHANM